jgi:hypothetical protein
MHTHLFNFDMEDTAGDDWESQAKSGEIKVIGEHEDAEQTPAGASASSVNNGKQTKTSTSSANSDKASARPGGRGKKGAKGVSALAAACRRHDLEAAAARSAGNNPASFVNEFPHETVADIDEITAAENQSMRGTAAVLPTAQTDAQKKFVKQRAAETARAEQETVQFIGAGKTSSKRKPTLGRDTGGWDDYR